MKNANPVSKLAGWLIFLWALGALAGCGGEAPAAAEAKPAGHYFPFTLGDRTVQLQVAISDSEMEQGLMYRRDLRTHQGMIFVYKQPRQVSFWMRNTPTPLDIGYFTSDGVLREIYPLYPMDERAVPSKRTDIQYAVELPQGWFDATGVKPGAKLDQKEIAAAVRARGFRARDFQGLR